MANENNVEKIHDNKDDVRQRDFDKYLEQVEEKFHHFYHAAFEGVPKDKTFGAKGIKFARGELVFCSPFRVSGQTRKGDKTGWTYIIEILSEDGEVVECELPAGLMEHQPRKAIAIMADVGFVNRTQQDEIISMIKSWGNKTILLSLEKVGWTPGYDAFALPSGKICTQQGSSAGFQFSGTLNAAEKGGKEEWTALSELCTGNTNLLFACSVGFAGPLLPFSPSIGTTIFHLFGKTSLGKTRTLRTACAIWPMPKDSRGKNDKSWASTSNGLEAQVAQANHMMLGLDELPKEPTPEFGDDVYKIANNSGKQRATKSGAAAEKQVWETFVFSTGEISMQAALKK